MGFYFELKKGTRIRHMLFLCLDGGKEIQSGQDIILDAPCRFRQTGHLTGAFTRSGWKQLIDVFQFEPCNL